MRDRDALLNEENLVDHAFDAVFGWRDRVDVPLTFSAWHWWTIDTTGLGRGGYGLEGYRGTNAYILTAAPEFELGNGRNWGGYMALVGKDGDFYRTYYTRHFWFLEGYLYYRTEELGTLKAGLLNTRFGLDNYLGFIGSVPYFDGFIRDGDYGLAWERSHQASDNLVVNSVAQFFFHDGEWNGSLINQDQESVAGIHERNTLLLRTAPTWTLDDESTLTLGISALVGEIDSRLPGFPSDIRTVWGMDVVYTRGPLYFQGEFLQWFGHSVPTRFASGGPSNRITSFNTEVMYTMGPVRYRAMYSAGFDSNPGGRQTIWNVGGIVKISEHVDLYVEYADWTVDGHATLNDFTVIEGPQIVLFWHY